MRLMVAGLLAVLTANARAQEPDRRLAERIDRYVAPYVRMNDLSGVLAVTRKGRVIFEGSYGLSNRELGTRNTVHTRFRIGSVSKQFTAAAILLLQERGALAVTDSLARYLPDFPGGDRITLRQLLTHSAGLARDLPNKREFSKSAHDLDELIRIAAAQPPAAEPGTRFLYSNLGYLVLAAVIERVSGQSFPSFLEQHVFVPLRMGETGTDESSRILPGRAAGYQTGVGRELVNAPFEDLSNETGYGSLYSTVPDLLTWQAAWNRRLLSTASWRELFTDHGEGHGYGVSVKTEGTHTVVGHDGSVAGFNAFVRCFPAEEICVAYAANVESGLLSRLQDDLPAVIFGEGYAVPPLRPDPVHLTPAELAPKQGTYEVFPGFTLEVQARGAELYLSGNGSELVALTPLSPVHFFYRHLYADVTFQADPSGVVTGLRWKDNSGEYPCRKIR